MRKSGNRVRIPAQLMETVLETRAFAVRSTKPSQKMFLSFFAGIATTSSCAQIVERRGIEI